MASQSQSPLNCVLVTLSLPESTLPAPQFPTRAIQLSRVQKVLRIGRASKALSKGIHEGFHNGFFESPVMSRSHAQIEADIDNQAVFIRDTGSLHGTWVNEDHVEKDATRLLLDGDRIRFGSSIQRGSTTFEPTTVRVGIDFLSAAESSNKMFMMHNRVFRVPGDDGEDAEELSDDLGSAVEEVTPKGAPRHVTDLTGDNEDETEAVIDLTSPPRELGPDSDKPARDGNVDVINVDAESGSGHGRPEREAEPDAEPDRAAVPPLPKAASVPRDAPRYSPALNRYSIELTDDEDEDEDEDNMMSDEYGPIGSYPSSSESDSDESFDTALSKLIRADTADLEEDSDVSTSEDDHDGEEIANEIVGGRVNGNAVSFIQWCRPHDSEDDGDDLFVERTGFGRRPEPATSVARAASPTNVPSMAVLTSTCLDAPPLPLGVSKKLNINAILNPSRQHSPERGSAVDASTLEPGHHEYLEARAANKITMARAEPRDDPAPLNLLTAAIRAAATASSTKDDRAHPSEDAAVPSGAGSGPVAESAPNDITLSPTAPKAKHVPDPSSSALLRSGEKFLNTPPDVNASKDVETTDDRDELVSAAVFQASKKRKADDMSHGCHVSSAPANLKEHFAELTERPAKRRATLSLVKKQKDKKANIAWAVVERAGFAALGGIMVLGSLIYSAPTFS